MKSHGQHAVRTKLAAATRKMCSETYTPIFVCCERYHWWKATHTAWKLRTWIWAWWYYGVEHPRDQKDLHARSIWRSEWKWWWPITLRQTLDIANGAQGEIVESILHPKEPSIGDSPGASCSTCLCKNWVVLGRHVCLANAGNKKAEIIEFEVQKHAWKFFFRGYDRMDGIMWNLVDRDHDRKKKVGENPYRLVITKVFTTVIRVI